MEDERTPDQVKCIACGFESDAGGGDWAEAEHPGLGTITACPECGSTNTTTLGYR